MTAVQSAAVYPPSALRATFPFNACGVKRDSKSASVAALKN